MKRPEGFDRGAQENARQTPPPADPRSATPPADPERDAQDAPGALGTLFDATARFARAATEPRPPRPQKIPRAAKPPTEAATRRRVRKAARSRRKFELAEMRRFTRRTRARRATWLTFVGVVAALGLVLAVAVYSPILALRTITIEGTDRIKAADLHAAVGDQLGTPLALVNFDRIKGELEAFPLIRSYVTETVPPDTLIIHVVEREPIASIKRGKIYDRVDPAGIVVSSSTKVGSLPVVSLGKEDTTGPSFAASVEVLLAMPKSVLKKVSGITAPTANSVQLTLTGDNPRVVWGNADDSELKARVLAKILRQSPCQAEQVINISAPLAVVCGPKQ